jgi:hypothetical protein
VQRTPLVVTVPLVGRTAVEQIHQGELVLETEHDHRARSSERRQSVQPLGPTEVIAVIPQHPIEAVSGDDHLERLGPQAVQSTGDDLETVGELGSQLCPPKHFYVAATR